MKARPIAPGPKLAVAMLEADDGECEALDYYDDLATSDRAKFTALFERLASHGSIRNEEKFRRVEGYAGLFELKIDGHRMTGFFWSSHFVITHGFPKVKKKKSQGEYRRADSLRKQFRAGNPK